MSLTTSKAFHVVRPWFFGLAVSTLVFLALVFLPAEILRFDQASFPLRLDTQKGVAQAIPAAESIDHYRGTLAQVFGGVAICLGLYFTARNVLAAEQTRWTRTFSDAVGQLGSNTSAGSPNVPIRVGAIYSLERLCNDSPADAPAVCNVLLQYIQAEAVQSREKNDFMLDCEAALIALSSITGGRSLMKGNTWLLADVFLPNLRILGRKVAGFNFRSSTLSGSRFDGSHHSSLQMEDCSLEGCSFAGSKIKEVRLSACRGSGLNFSSCRTKAAHFISCMFPDSDFTHAKMSHADFSDTDISGSDFSSADMRNIVTSGTNMTNVSLHNADLGNADLRGAIGLTRAEMESARVKPPKRFMPSTWLA